MFSPLFGRIASAQRLSPAVLAKLLAYSDSSLLISPMQPHDQSRHDDTSIGLLPVLQYNTLRCSTLLFGSSPKMSSRTQPAVFAAVVQKRGAAHSAWCDCARGLTDNALRLSVRTTLLEPSQSLAFWPKYARYNHSVFTRSQSSLEVWHFTLKTSSMSAAGISEPDSTPSVWTNGERVCKARCAARD